MELTINQSQVLECIKQGIHNHYDIRNQTDIRLDRVYEAIRSLRNKKVIKPKPSVTGEYEVLIADYEIRKVVRTRKKKQKTQINSITRLIMTIPEEMRERVRKLHELPRSQIVRETGLNKVQVCLILDKLRTDGKLPRRVEDDDDITFFRDS
jgi:sugar-specific transcriptional regulator TrmB